MVCGVGSARQLCRFQLECRRLSVDRCQERMICVDAVADGNAGRMRRRDALDDGYNLRAKEFANMPVGEEKGCDVQPGSCRGTAEAKSSGRNEDEKRSTHGNILNNTCYFAEPPDGLTISHRFFRTASLQTVHCRVPSLLVK